MNKPRILLLDIETAPIKAYVWRLWDQNVGLNQIVDNGGVLCVGAKWLGEKDRYIFSDWADPKQSKEHNHLDMLYDIWNMLNEADAVVTYNGDRFDLPKLYGEFLLNGFGPPPPVTSIDVYKAVKKLGFISNKLAFVGPLLKLGAKIKVEGFELWTKVMDGDAKAQSRMERYCLQDVKLLERVYKKVRPFIRNHPHLGEKAHECGACGSNRVQKRGFRRTKSFLIQRVQCISCGSWQDGVRHKVV